VLGKIEELQCSQEFSRANFGLTEYEDSHGRKQPMYKLTQSGFSFLVMGFNGKKAARFKEKYIIAFEQMRGHILCFWWVFNHWRKALYDYRRL
jgi:Rha family phage regulatory protein